jgi:branched-chain amino acid transport system substrate-binding protein
MHGGNLDGGARRGARMRRSSRAVAVLGVAVCFAVAACGSSSSGGSSGGAASAPGVTATTVTVGFVTSLTGPYSPFFALAKPGFAARIALQNSQGGVDGRQIVVDYGDDQSNASAELTSVRALVLGKNIFALVQESALGESGVPFLKSEGVPVVGSSQVDGGTEWGPTTNFIAIDGSTPTTNLPVARATGLFFKQQGVTNMGFIGVNAQSEALEAKSIHKSLASVGVNNTYINDTVPDTQLSGFGGVVEALHSQGVNGIFTGLPAQGPGFLQALVSAGVRSSIKAYVSGAPFTASELNSAEGEALIDGVWAQSEVTAPYAQTSAAKMFRAAMAKYAGVTAGLDQTAVIGWIDASAIIQGLQLAGQHPTRQAFLQRLRAMTDFTGSGMEIEPVNLTAAQGTSAQAGIYPNGCLWYSKYQGQDFIAQPKPICDGLTAQGAVVDEPLGRYSPRPRAPAGVRRRLSASAVTTNVRPLVPRNGFTASTWR